MRKYARALALLLPLALGITLLALPSGLSADEDAEIKKTQQAILKIADAKEADAKKMAEKLAKDAFLEDIMRVFKPKKRKGIGVGPKGTGIELKIISLSRRSLPKTKLKEEADDLVKAAKVTQAVAYTMPFYAPKRKRAGMDPADWAKYSEQMRKASIELAKAAKAGDPAMVKKAATNVNASCVDCHSTFRD